MTLRTPGSATDFTHLKLIGCCTDMLAKYFEVPSGKEQPEPEKRRQTKKAANKTKGAKRSAVAAVEPFEGGTVHARFDPPSPGVAQKGILESEAESETLGEDANDPYEYLSAHDCDRDDDADSMNTYDDSDASDALSTSPSVGVLERAWEPAFKRRTKTSEAPVYSGPELWYESDDYIE